MSHAPVLLNEAIAALAPADGEVHVDATFGGGGYTSAILAASDCKVIAIDRDPEAIARGQDMQAESGGRLRLLAGAFGALGDLVGADIDGVVFDFGVSSFQLDTPARGFSFRFEAPLDMRMSLHGPHAGDAINELSEAAIAQAIFVYGDEPGSRRIARALVATRRNGKIETTAQLADIVEKALGGRRGARTHPATRTFQALRMLVNDELGQIAKGLLQSEQRLKSGGRLVCVSFHSLEDRLVKTFLTTRTKQVPQGSRYAPIQALIAPASFQTPTRKAKAPEGDETAANPRARSAKMRVGVRTDAPPFPDATWTDPAPVARQEWERLL
jgi:16S rRNA (cytosine1402-N4)-methyltransferase